MKIDPSSIRFTSLVVSLALLLILSPSLFAQGYSNTISGRITGVENRPVVDLYIELLDELGRTIARTRSRGGGFYRFSDLSSGRFTVRVLTSGTDYEEQENTVTIYSLNPNMTSDEQIDFRLKLRPGIVIGPPASLFVQEVPAEAKSAYEKALSDLGSGKRDIAIAGLKRAIELFPRYFHALERLGVEYLKRDNPMELRAAGILFEAATEVNPRGYTSWFGLAYSLNKLKVYDRALPAAAKAVELQPESVDALTLSGAILRNNHQFKEAEKQLLKAKEVSLNPSPQIHWELALLYGNHMKRYKDAAKELRAFLAASPNARDADSIKKLIADFEGKAAPK